MVTSSVLSTRTVDPSVPMHVRVRADLEAAISSGLLKPGDQLPSEAELCERYGVSKTPVRQALQALEASHLIYRAQGRGAFVRERKIGGVLRDFAGLSDELRQSGHTVEPTTISMAVVPADALTADALRIPQTAHVLSIQRLYVVDAEPLVVFEHRLSPVVPSDVVRAAGNFTSLYGLLRSIGINLTAGEETIGATLLTKSQAGLLQVRRPAAALLLSRTSRTREGVPVEFTTYVM